MPPGMAARLRPVHAGWQVLAMAPRPTEEGYAAAVRAALSRMADTRLPALHKVVLARTLELELSQAIDPLALTRRLAADPAVATFLIDLSAWSGVADHSFLGATPELLVSRRGRRVVSHPLAGSAARLPDAAADRAAGESLLGSDKDRREHRMVVEDILDRLAPYCSQLSTPEGTALRSTRTMWHLGTRIEGRLKGADMPSAAGLAALLHPTPAVGGYPREAALEAIRELEGQDRGFYAGAIGWAEGSGDGDWYVALRCAEIRSRRVLLHAGAGIVAGSDAEAEVEETSAKFRAMLVALGVGEEEELKELAS